VVRVRVLVTGGTGFVGSHSVAALLAQGHHVRLLVRSPDRIAAALEPLGVDPEVDHVVGDVTDPASVATALAGCDAVLHAAAVYKIDARAHREIARTNVAGADIVLRAAVERGLDPVVHVSSTVALLQRRATVTPDSPLATARSVYVRSKADSEAVARRLQDGGAPVVIVQPGAVFGPHDPHLSDFMRRLRDILRGLYPMWPRGGHHHVDVRDVASVHAAVMEPGRGPRSYLVPGQFVDAKTMFATLRALTGRRLPNIVVPAWLVLPTTWVASKLQRITPFHLPLEHEGALVTLYATHYDDSRTREEFGIQPRPLAETYADAIRWLHETGRISTRQAGQAAAADAKPRKRDPLQDQPS
jgi:dihydroflavonol-4-reductase